MSLGLESEIYLRMYIIRKVEEEIRLRYPEGKMRCPVHLSIGQEGPAVGIALGIYPEDRVLSNHRCHAHYLALGGSIAGLIGELYGKSSGCAGGWGGSMHLTHEEGGLLGTSAIVGSSISVALGVAMALKASKSDAAAIVIFGDAARETGQFYESLNMAALHNLPILFVCEDNGYATSAPLDQRQPIGVRGTNIPGSMGIKVAVSPNGSAETVRTMTSELREGRLPAYLHIPTYRFLGHVGMNQDLEYRTLEEVNKEMDKDELPHLRGVSAFLDQEESRILKEISDAFREAEESPWPEVAW